MRMPVQTILCLSSLVALLVGCGSKDKDRSRDVPPPQNGDLNQLAAGLISGKAWAFKEGFFRTNKVSFRGDQERMVVVLLPVTIAEICDTTTEERPDQRSVQFPLSNTSAGSYTFDENSKQLISFVDVNTEGEPDVRAGAGSVNILTQEQVLEGNIEATYDNTDSVRGKFRAVRRDKPCAF